MNPTAKILMVSGAFLLVLGIFWQFAGRFLHLGKLPGDIAIERENFKFYFPLATSLLLSLILSLVLFLIQQTVSKGGQMLEAGKSFPEFSLNDQDHNVVRSNEFKGKWMVVYIYPKDDTPGCTLEGRSFSAMKAEFEKANAVVLGLSADDSDSHKSFCDKHKLTITLLADPDAKLLSTLGVEKTMHQGKSFWNRTTFLVDPKGVIRKVYKNVNPQGHEKLVLQDIKSMK